jgi:hypothetical protein
MVRKSGDQPPLKLVSSAPTDASSPPKFGRSGAALWKAVAADYEITDPGDIATLVLVCQSRDRLDEISKRIAADGVMVRGRTALRAHPLLRTEATLSSFIVRSLRALGINNAEEVRPVGRPSQGFGVTWRQLDQDDD